MSGVTFSHRNCWTHLPENVCGGQLNTKDGYGLGGIGLQSRRKPPSHKGGSCEGRLFYFAGLVFLLTCSVSSDHRYRLATLITSSSCSLLASSAGTNLSPTKQYQNTTCHVYLSIMNMCISTPTTTSQTTSSVQSLSWPFYLTTCSW